MTLQSQRLAMAALGVESDAPPTSLQPPLHDGVHLRWATDALAGFPWHGFHLFRREHAEGEPICGGRRLWRMLAERQPTTTLASAEATLRSRTPMATTMEFNGELGLDLRPQDRVTVEPPAPVPARRVLVRLGFLDGATPAEDERRCLTFKGEPHTEHNPLEQDGFAFEVLDFHGTPMAETRFVDWGTSSGSGYGLDCGWTTHVRLPKPATTVLLTMTTYAAPSLILGLDEQGVTVARERTTLASGETEVVRLEAPGGIASLSIHSEQNEVVLHQICWENTVAKPGTADGGISVVARHGDVPLASDRASGAPGDVVTVDLAADAIEAVDVGGGPAVLLDVCFVPVDQGIGDGWELLNDFSYPMALPVQHPDYPALTGGVDLGTSEKIALNRVRYGDPADWGGTPFEQLHETLLELVEKGPNGPPMSARQSKVAGKPDGFDPGFAAPDMPARRPLDLVLLGSLNAAIAEMVGLLFTDESAPSGVRFDYMIVADHKGAGGGDPHAILKLVGANDFSSIDAWICFDVARGPAAPLPEPGGVRSYALPGTTRTDVDGNLVEATSSAGVRWSAAVTAGGSMLPRQPVLFHVWRASLGDGPNPDPIKHLDLPTMDRPVVNARPATRVGVPPPSDWPPIPMHYVDRGLQEGWYGYRVSGIDIFGRHSAQSGNAAWYQWAPAPSPAPWYYVQPPGDKVVHPWAVRLLDKSGPPQPTGVEASALDPEDPFLVRDAMYDAWRNGLDTGEPDTLVGLRVRWIWTEGHMRAAPRTREFRIYWNPGSTPPKDHGAGKSWATRLFVVPYDQHWAAGTDDDGRPLRIYELILPVAGDPVRVGADLPVTQADPILYANVGVAAADDRAHVPDDPARKGRWAGRPGNEGAVGPVAKVVRVHRKRPDPPIPPLDGEALLASPADYHGLSYYTYRWRASGDLKAHVFRAVDESIFLADWRRRETDPVLDPADGSAFPSDARWNADKRAQVAAELNALNAFARDPAGRAQAMAYYRKLSNDGLRVLAGLKGNEAAFVQITTVPLDPAVNADRIGPDNPGTYTVDPSLRAFVDSIDGRSTNSWFYRCAYVDKVHNRSLLSLASPPVRMPDVLPPRTPTIASVTLGDGKATVAWASNREPDLASYRLYRGEGSDGSGDVRDMVLLHTLTVPAGAPGDRPATVEHVDMTLVGGRRYAYRVVAVDAAGNASAPSEPFDVFAVDTRPPPPPVYMGAEWVLWQAVSERVEPWPANGVIPADRRPALRLRWDGTPPGGRVVITRRDRGALRFQPVPTAAAQRSATGTVELVDAGATPGVVPEYRLVAFSAAGVPSDEPTQFEVPLP